METLVIEGREVLREGGRVRRPEAYLDRLPLFRTHKGWDGDWDDDGTLLISESSLKTVWDVHFVISVNTFWKSTWHVALLAVAPSAPDASVLDAALQLSNVHPEEIETKNLMPLQIEALVKYGASATLTDFYSERPRSAVLAAMAECMSAVPNFTLYMDAPVNKLGTTGWDLIQGLVPAPAVEKRDTRVSL